MIGVAGHIGRWTTNPVIVDPGGGTGTPPPPDLKPSITGVLPRNQGEGSGRTNVIGAVVAQTNMATLMPTRDGPIATGSTGPNSWAAITTARGLRKPDGTKLPYRLRIMIGVEAPLWFKQIGSTANPKEPLYIANVETPGDTMSQARFWLPEAKAEFVDFMQKMAALLDDDPQLVDIAVHIATGHYAEPFQRGFREVKGSIASLPNFGKTNPQVYYEAGHGDVVKDAQGRILGPSPVEKAAIMFPFDMVPGPAGTDYQIPRWQSWGWEHTRMFIPFNPHQAFYVKKTAQGVPLSPFAYEKIVDPADWMVEAIDTMVTNMGPRVVLGNTSIRPPLGPPGALGPDYGTMYERLIKAGGGKAANSFQTATLARIGESARTVVPTMTDYEAAKETLRIGSGLRTQSNDIAGGNGGWLPPSISNALRCRSIELWPGWRNTFPTSDDSFLQSVNEKCAANPDGDDLA